MDMQKLFSLKGKTAFVSGASGALGGASARALAHAGADLALCYNSHKDRMDKLVAELEPLGGKIRTYQVNVLDRDAIRENADAVINDFGRLDVLVNIAGGNMDGAVYGYTQKEQSIFELDLQRQFDVVNLNLFGGCIWPCLLYGKKMLGNPDGGSIINCTSINGIRPLRGRTAYAAAKAGIVNFTESMAAHIAGDINPKIRVNSIAPGFFPNFRGSQMIYKEDGSLGERARNGINATPMRRMGEPDELAGTIIWLASDASSYVNGAMIAIDGGYLIHSPA